MRFSHTLCILSISLTACAAPTSDDAADSQENGYSSPRSRGAAEPLSGDELRFQKYLHVDSSTAWSPSHSYAEYSAYPRANGKRCGVDAALYLEADRTFTLYYTELEMVDQYNGRPIAKRKLTGTWRANGATLELGTTASGRTVMTTDWFGHDTEGLAVSLPEGWVSAGLATEIPTIMGGSNVGPNAVFWEDHH